MLARASVAADDVVVLLDGGKHGLARRVGHRRHHGARDLLLAFGKLRPAPDGVDVSVAVAAGAAEIAPVVRVLDEAGFKVAALELVEPSLDDVFAEKTGRHLEGAAQPAATPA